MTAASLWELSAREGITRLATGEMTAEAWTAACLQRVSEREPAVQAWEFLDPTLARAQAWARDQLPVDRRGPLHGIPIGVKDIFDTADQPTTYGSPIYAGHQPRAEAAVVALARAAGAVVMGKTVTTEFASYHPGKTTNPHHPNHTPGGSSSGSAAAVAAGMVPLAFGTQTGGSIIRPAAFCGIVGYKPTFGLLPRAGVKPLAETLDTIGVFARTVLDAAWFVAALTGREELRGAQESVAALSSGPLRIGICRTPQWSFAGPETVALFKILSRELPGVFAELGTVSEAELPAEFRRLAAAHVDIMGVESAASLAWERLSHGESLSARLRGELADAAACPPDRYDAALDIARECRECLDAEVFTEWDLLIAPSVVGEAPAGLARTGDPVFNRVWTTTHVPCIHLPCGRGPNGLPLGVQLIGPRGADAGLLAAAARLHPPLRQIAEHSGPR